jgi:hypothetical protein
LVASSLKITDDGVLGFSKLAGRRGFASPSVRSSNTEFAVFDGSLASSPPRKSSLNDDAFAPARAPKALLLPKALKPPLVGSGVTGATLEGDAKADFVVLPSADVNPKAGFELPRTEGLPKTDVVLGFGGVLVGVNDPEDVAKADTGLVPTSFGGL